MNVFGYFSNTVFAVFTAISNITSNKNFLLTPSYSHLFVTLVQHIIRSYGRFVNFTSSPI